jgi:hypothetical protein
MKPEMKPQMNTDRKGKEGIGEEAGAARGGEDEFSIFDFRLMCARHAGAQSKI